MNSGKDTKLAKMNILTTCNDDKGRHCGYCNSENGSYSFGFETNDYSAELYESMMFCGWRRCGNYTYKPNLAASCCKLYTCRLDINKFKINKNQKKVMKRFREYIAGEYEGEKTKEPKKNEENKESSKPLKKDMILSNQNDAIHNRIEETIDEYLKSNYYDKVFLTDITYEKIKPKLVIRKNPLRDEKTHGNYSSNVFLILVNSIKTTNEKKNLYDNLFQNFDLFCKENTLLKHNEAFTNSLSTTGHVNFTITNDEIKKTFIETITIESKNQKKTQREYQQKINEKPKNIYQFEYFDELVTEPPVTQIKHKYTIELTSQIEATDEKFAIYKQYQMAVHKDKEETLSQEKYNGSWGNTNFKDKIKINLPNDLKHKEIYPEYYGSYNLIHRLDGKIFAVGVIDILPSSVSSVYLYYDPHFSFLDPGVFTAIKEIEYLQSLNKLISNQMKYYMMGFYSDTCQKMKYKGEYSPMELLDPLTNNYVLLDAVKDKIKSKELVKLTNEPIKDWYYTSEEIEKIFKIMAITYKGNQINFVNYVEGSISANHQEFLKILFKRFLMLLGKNFIKNIEFCIVFR